MIYVVGRSYYGAVDEVDGACVATQFTFFNGVPILPLDTYVLFRQERGAARRVLRIPRDRRSLALGYARPWSALLLLATTMGVFLALVTREIGGGVGLAVSALPLASLAFFFWSLGGTKAERRGQIRAYFVATGIPADPARLGGLRDKIATDLRAVLIERCTSAVREDYRDVAAARPSRGGRSPWIRRRPTGRLRRQWPWRVSGSFIGWRERASEKENSRRALGQAPRARPAIVSTPSSVNSTWRVRERWPSPAPLLAARGPSSKAPTAPSTRVGAR